MNFKDIPSYEGLYQVSDCGQVKSLERPHNSGGIKKEKILKPRLDRYGYEYVVLYKDGVRKTNTVHRLVMYTHSHVDNEMTVNHIDENKRNNHISNLEYCTQAENVRKYNKNNPEHTVKAGKKGGGNEAAKKAVKEKKGHKYLDTHTGITYASMKEVGLMMHETGQAKSKWVWFKILQSGKPQDRFVRI
jgi:hypothetical protein